MADHEGASDDLRSIQQKINISVDDIGETGEHLRQKTSITKEGTFTGCTTTTLSVEEDDVVAGRRKVTLTIDDCERWPARKSHEEVLHSWTKELLEVKRAPWAAAQAAAQAAAAHTAAQAMGGQGQQEQHQETGWVKRARGETKSVVEADDTANHVEVRAIYMFRKSIVYRRNKSHFFLFTIGVFLSEMSYLPNYGKH